MQGFIFLEIVFSSLLLTIGTPSFQTLIQGNRIINVGSTIQHSLMFTCSQPVNLMSYVTVCPLNGNICGND